MTRPAGPVAPTRVCALCLHVAVAGGCSDVRVADDTSASTSLGGATSTSDASSSATGGAEPTPRLITLEYRGNGNSPIDDGRVLVSDADGTLRESLLPSELPAEVLVADGQLVSFLRRDGILGQMSAHPLRIDSFRVGPSVTTKILGGEAPWGPTCDVEPMTVTVDFAEVPDIYAYEAFSTDDAGSWDGPSPVASIEVSVCDGTTFDVLATARGYGSTLGYELFDELAFIPGGELHLSTTTSSIERATLDITVEGLEGASFLYCDASWRRLPIWLSSESALDLQLPLPPATVAWTATPIVPGGPGYGETALFCLMGLAAMPDGACGGSSSRRIVESAPGTSQTIDLDHGLARVEPVGASGWTFAERGEIGDVVWVAMDLGAPGDPLWYLREDPAFPAAPPTFPALPPDLPPDLVPSTTTPTLTAVGHQDYEGVAGFGDVAAGADWSGSYRMNRTGSCL